MRFYTVTDEYIEFLQKLDNRVYNNSGTGYKAKKAYIGVVLEIGSHKFVAPLTSYKPAQDRIQSSHAPRSNCMSVQTPTISWA